MDSLPDRPDIRQLRRRARELLRAATAGDPRALARLDAVSGRRTLSVAQLAVAREHGFTSWRALRAEVDRRQLSEIPLGVAQPKSPEPQMAWDDRWSFGRAQEIPVEAGVLRPSVLVAGPGGATLHAWLTLRATTRREPPQLPYPGSGGSQQTRIAMAEAAARSVPAEFGDVVASDDKGTKYGLRAEVISGAGTQPARNGETARLRLRLDSVPPRECPWIELRSAAGAATRLVPAGRPGVRLGPVTPAQAGSAQETARDQELPENAAADGMTCQLDIPATLPALDGASVRIDTLVSEADGWNLYLRAAPGWWSYSPDGRHKRSLITVHGRDNLGDRYLGSFDGSTGRGSYEDVILKLAPRLNPRATVLTLTFTGTAEQVSVDVHLA